MSDKLITAGIGIFVGIFVTIVGFLSTDILKSASYFSPKVQWGEVYAFSINGSITAEGVPFSVKGYQVSNTGRKPSGDIKIFLERAPKTYDVFPAFPVTIDSANDKMTVISLPGLAADEKIELRIVGEYTPTVLRVTAGGEVAEKVWLTPSALEYSIFRDPFFLFFIAWSALFLFSVFFKIEWRNGRRSLPAVDSEIDHPSRDAEQDDKSGKA